MAVIKWLTNRQLEKKFEPYAVELGKLVYAWNRLHEKMAALFWSVTGVANGGVTFAIWYSTTNDRAQREMLRAAANATIWPATLDAKTVLADINWLVARVNSLADQRNDAIHSPYLMSTGAEGTTVKSHDFFGNPRARKLAGKDLLKEFRWYRECADVLSIFADRMHNHLAFPKIEPTWPKKPQLPHLGQVPTRAPKRPRKSAKPSRLRRVRMQRS